MDHNLSFGDRVCRITWGWFSITMSTGSIATLLYNTPHQFPGLLIIGKIFFILDICLYISVWLALLYRFHRLPGTLQHTLRDPEEAYLLPTAALGFATILFGIQLYGLPACGVWLRWVLLVLFWVYVAIASLFAIVLNWHLYKTKMATLQPFWLVRLLPSFPAMLAGTTASLLASSQPPYYATPMLLAGTTLQGFGFLISLFIYAEYMYGLHFTGLPPMRRRPQMFIAVGPPSFTAVALIGMAEISKEKLPTTGYIPAAGDLNTSGTLLTFAVFVSIFMWFTGLFFYCISWLSIFDAMADWKFDITWWSIVFPNTGFALAIIKIGDMIDSEAVKGVGSAATIVQVGSWVVCAVLHMWAVWTRRILWPGFDEGYMEKEEEEESSEV